VRIRPATSADSVEVLRWRNDLDSRMNSRDSETISLETHEVWFEKVLSNPEQVLLIGEDTDGRPMGQVRFDRMGIEPLSYELSITLAPEARGRGLALELLTAAEVCFLDTRGSLQLRAFVNNGNKVSERLFLGSGYSIESLVDTSGQWWVKEIHV
jgi:RimJ/RimL family protein N-acetyltransferase